MKDLCDIFTENERDPRPYSGPDSEDMGFSIDRILEMVESEESVADDED
jgi:hypothetical protein